jgi:hypothetical protein
MSFGATNKKKVLIENYKSNVQWGQGQGGIELPIKFIRVSKSRTAMYVANSKHGKLAAEVDHGGRLANEFLDIGIVARLDKLAVPNGDGFGPSVLFIDGVSFIVFADSVGSAAVTRLVAGRGATGDE